MPNWNELFKDERFHWRDPHDGLVELTREWVRAQPRMHVLDLGCGAGRHMVYLESQGLDVTGCDIARNGLVVARDWLLREKRPARLIQVEMTALPYPKHTFDALISTYVIHHNSMDKIRRTLDEMERVLRPGGCVFIIVASRRGERFGEGTRLEPGTYVSERGEDAGVPHHFFGGAELAAEMERHFIVRRMVLEEEMHAGIGRSSHWVVLAQKPLPGDAMR